MPCRNIGFAENHVEVLNEQLSLIVGSFVPTKVIGMLNKFEPSFNEDRGLRSTSSRKLIKSGLVIALELTEVSCPPQVSANEVYADMLGGGGASSLLEAWMF